VCRDVCNLCVGMCVKCGRSVMGEKSRCVALDQLFHVDCFRCSACSESNSSLLRHSLYHHSRNASYRVTTCLENLEMSGNLKHVREMSGMLLTVTELSGKKSCHGKVSQNCSLLGEYFRSCGYLVAST